jgi:DNA-binding transcriptional MerR regulator
MVDQLLPPIPAKRYFTIGEVSELCAVKPHVLRYWEQEFTQLRPMKRRGNRRYYQHHEVLLIRKIRELLYDEGFTIQGARMRLSGRQTISNLQAEAAAVARLQRAEQVEAGSHNASERSANAGRLDEPDSPVTEVSMFAEPPEEVFTVTEKASALHMGSGDELSAAALNQLRKELTEALRLLSIA